MPLENDKSQRKKNLFRKATQEALSDEGKESKKSLPNQTMANPEGGMAQERLEIRKIDPKSLSTDLEYKEKNKKWLFIGIGVFLLVLLIWFWLSPGKKAEIYLANTEIYREQIKDLPKTNTLLAEKSLHVYFDFKRRIGRDILFFKVLQIDPENKKEEEIETREVKIKPDWSYVKYLFQEHTFSPGQEYKIMIYDNRGKLLAESNFTLN